MLHYNEQREPSGLIFNIQKYTIHDGPGIRTELFFSGCSLNCIWCSNPESISPRREFGIYPEKCLSKDKCGLCVKNCPQNGTPILFDEDGLLTGIKRSVDCAECLRCADVCPPRAIKIWGQLYTVPQLMEIILKDRAFYTRSGGGVTLSGGEVMLQWEFAAMLLAECRRNGIQTCVETALHCPWEHAAEVFKYTDIIITDIKHMNPKKHREYTGADNSLILENIKNAAGLRIPIIIRTPVVPDYNSSDDDLRETAAFISTLPDNVFLWQLLPYRKMGTEKYASLGIIYPMEDYNPPEREVWEANLLRLQLLLSSEYNVPAVAGSSGKIVIPK